MMNIIVTGAGKGLGLELVKKFAQDPGNKIIAVSRNIKALNDNLTQAQTGKLSFSEIIPFSFDLVKGDYRELLSFVNLHVKEIHILVNNAGYLVNKPFLGIDMAEFNAAFDTNVKAPFRLVQTLFPLLVKGSHIVNISSMGGYQGSVKFPGLSVYSASKGALSTLTECLAEELKEQGIAVNALAIGSVQTEMLEQAFPGYQAPVTAVRMAEYVAEFARTGQLFYNGKVLPVALSTP